MRAMSEVLRGEIAQEYRESQLKDGVLAAERIARRADPAAHAQLWLVQLVLPDLVAALEKAIVEGAEQPRVRHLAGGLLTYVYNPLDLIGDETPIGRLDDAIICAKGLLRLQELEGLQLDPHVAAICNLAVRALALLDDDLKNGIERFVENLEASTETVPPSRARI